MDWNLSGWLLLPAVAAPLVAAWPAWRDGSARRRQWLALAAVPFALVVLTLSSMLLDALVAGAQSPVLADRAAWLVAAVGVAVVAASWAASRLAWTGHRPWGVLSAALVLLLLAASGDASREGDGRSILALLAALAFALALPWALYGAVVGRGPAWRAQVAALGLAAVPLLLLGLGGALPLLLSEGPQPATDAVTFTVEPEGSGPYEVWVRPPWDWEGPWGSGLLDGDLSRFTSVEGDGTLRDGPGGGLVVAGEGPVTVRLFVRFYGPIEMQESSMHGNATVESDAPVSLRVEHRNRAPYCAFSTTWEGRVPGGERMELAPTEGGGVCA